MSYKLSDAVNPPVAFLLNQSDLESRWDPNYYHWMREFHLRMEACPYPVTRLRKSLNLVQYGSSERANDSPEGLPMLRMLNLQDDTWDISDLKYIEMSEDDKKRYLLKHDDILFNRTNSKELVGKCGVFNLPGEYVFASYLIRVRLEPDTFLPHYVTAFLSSGLGRIQIDAVSRQIAGMTNVNAEEIRDLWIPDPGPTVQRQIVERWQAAVQQRDQTLDEAKEVLAGTDDVLLAELGIPHTHEPTNTLERRMFFRKFSDLSGNRLDPVAQQPRRWKLEKAIQDGAFAAEPLRNCVKSIKETVRSISVEDTYVGLENINGSTGEYVATTEKDSVSTALRFKAGQILFPKLRPYLNKTYFAEFDGVCSTEFHVFSPYTLKPNYLTEFLRSHWIVGITSCLMTGNTLPRLQMCDIERLPIPLPPESVQRRICDRIETLRQQAQQLRKNARADLEQARCDIEALILGQGN